MISVYIDGQEGTTGLQLKNRLQHHPMVELMPVPAENRKDPAWRKRQMNQADVVFLCLPDEAAKEAVTFVTNTCTVVIDASTAHRVDPQWIYGFPELSVEQFRKIAKGKRIANPGCHATGMIALVAPMIRSGYMGKGYPVTVHSITGYSGGGKKMIASYEGEQRPDTYDAPRQYGTGQNHKHLPEMQWATGLTMAPVFNPIVCDFYRGMAVSVPIHVPMLEKKATPEELMEMLDNYYKDSLLINVKPCPDDGFIPSNHLAGTCCMDLYVGGNEERITLTAVFDNLGKGASGAAVENMNIAMGWEPTLSLL